MPQATNRHRLGLAVRAGVGQQVKLRVGLEAQYYQRAQLKLRQSRLAAARGQAAALCGHRTAPNPPRLPPGTGWRQGLAHRRGGAMRPGPPARSKATRSVTRQTRTSVKLPSESNLRPAHRRRLGSGHRIDSERGTAGPGQRHVAVRNRSARTLLSATWQGHTSNATPMLGPPPRTS